tara:strand:+ start:273 stop:1034 length:762 start_codon:yes stop_codon:yes gene_type:complete
MFFSSKLKKIESVKHCFFSRENGFSTGKYKSLNCGLGSNDKKENVIKNLELVSKKIGCQKEFLITLNQKHSNQVIHFRNQQSIKNKLTGDSIVSEVKNVGIGILTADCAPILFYDPVKKIIGCVHSGWKGALNGIIDNTIKKFNEIGSNNNDLISVIGPCIGKQSYEVRDDLYKKFIDQNFEYKNCFEKISDNKYNFDLRGVINKKLSDLNIKNIENINIDTFSEKKFFYSYRRSVVNRENDYGRCISVIIMT